VRYLQEDCSDALTKMKMIFKPGAVDLPPESAQAHAAQITVNNSLFTDFTASHCHVCRFVDVPTLRFA
jgi:hypothetical protein